MLGFEASFQKKGTHHLFQFKARHQGIVYVEETTNERARRLALYEMHAFKEIVKSRMDELV